MGSVDLTKPMKLVWDEPVRDGEKISIKSGSYQIIKSGKDSYTAYKKVELVKLDITKTADEARAVCDQHREQSA